MRGIDVRLHQIGRCCFNERNDRQLGKKKDVKGIENWLIMLNKKISDEPAFAWWVPQYHISLKRVIENFHRVYVFIEKIS